LRVIPKPNAVTLLVIEVLDQLNIAYLVGGSLASTVHGELRTTLDSDLVADLHPEHIPPFVKALESAFYLDEGMIREAVDRRGSFDLIHLNLSRAINRTGATPQRGPRARLRRHPPH
jgi:hypothetical protein